MISLVGIAVKITGAEIPGLNLEVKINMMQLVITVEQVPDGTGRSRSEDLQHLGLIQVQLTVVSHMGGRTFWAKFFVVVFLLL